MPYADQCATMADLLHHNVMFVVKSKHSPINVQCMVVIRLHMNCLHPERQ